tara:strand:- start:378 stop:545 length:168 start_codon:yes stop_codon:yes gene_type:complete
MKNNRVEEIVRMLRWIKENGESYSGDPVNENDMILFIKLVEQYFEMDLEKKIIER